MGKRMIRLYDVEGDVIADILDDEDFDEILPQLDAFQAQKLFVSMTSAIQCFEGGENVEVNSNNFSDIMCEWSNAISEAEDYENEDGEIVFEYYTTKNIIPDNADYYTIQSIVDGFGNDSYVIYSTQSKEKAIEYVNENGYDIDNIIPQYFDKKFNNIDEYEY